MEQELEMVRIMDTCFNPKKKIVVQGWVKVSSRLFQFQYSSGIFSLFFRFLQSTHRDLAWLWDDDREARHGHAVDVHRPALPHHPVCVTALLRFFLSRHPFYKSTLFLRTSFKSSFSSSQVSGKNFFFAKKPDVRQCNWLIDWFSGWSIDWLSGWLIDWLVGLDRIERVIDWLIDWVIDWVFEICNGGLSSVAFSEGVTCYTSADDRVEGGGRDN